MYLTSQVLGDGCELSAEVPLIELLPEQSDAVITYNRGPVLLL